MIGAVTAVSVSERDRLTVFGAHAPDRATWRDVRSVGGKSRFLAGGLVLALIAFLGLIGWWVGAPQSGQTDQTGLAGTDAPAGADVLASDNAAGATPDQTAAASGAEAAIPETAPNPAPDLAPNLAPDPDLAPDLAPDQAPDLAPDLASDLASDLAPVMQPPAAALDDMADTLATGADTEPPVLSSSIPIASAMPSPPNPAPVPDTGLPAIGGPTQPGGAALALALAAGGAISPADADRFYAATGVWLRAPRLPLLPQADSVADLGLPAAPTGLGGQRQAATLAMPGPDAGLPPQRDPPPAGATYPRDAQGRILASPEGTLLPSGIVIYAAAPPLNPPTRPGTPPPAAPQLPDATAPAAAAIPAAPEAAVPAVPPALDPAPGTAPQTPPAADAVAPADPGAQSPAAAGAPDPGPDGAPPTLGPLPPWTGISPAVRPASFAQRAAATIGVVSTETAAAEAGADAAAAALALTPVPTPTDPVTAVTPGGVSLTSLTTLRPLVRPVPDVPVQTGFSGARPGPRPDGLAPEPAPGPAAEPAIAEDAAPDATAPSPTLPVAPAIPDLEAALVAIVATSPDPLAGATRLAVAQARRPDIRPRNFDRVVARATERLARAQPAAAPATSPGSVGTGGLAPEEQAEDAPIEVAAAAVTPSGPIPGGVAQAATQQNVLTLREINLIGVYGRPDERRALVRLPNGRYLRVGLGDNLDGGRVSAIDTDALNYVKRGRTIRLEIPNG